MADDEGIHDPDFLARALVNALGRTVGRVRMSGKRSEQAAQLSRTAHSVERITARLDELSGSDLHPALGPIPGLQPSDEQDAPGGPYQQFIEVVAHRFTGEHRRALTGELIAVYAEVNRLFACTKGGAARTAWLACAAELERCMGLYRTAWRRFAAEVGTGDWETPPSPTLGPATTRAFQAAVDGLRTARDVFKRDVGLADSDVWGH